MTKAKRPEVKLRGQPSKILKRLRPAFKTHVRPHTENQKGERLGGGSILNAQWNHRLSRDVDVYLRLATKEDGRAIEQNQCRSHPNTGPNNPVRWGEPRIQHSQPLARSETPREGAKPQPTRPACRRGRAPPTGQTTSQRG